MTPDRPNLRCVTTLPIVEMVFLSALVGTFILALLIVFIGILVAYPAAQCGESLGERAGSLCGAAAVGIVAMLVQRIPKTGSRNPWHWSIACFFVVFACSYFLDRYLIERTDWTRFRWAVSTMPVGVLCGGLIFSNIKLMHGSSINPHDPELLTKDSTFNAAIWFITWPIRALIPNRWSTVSAAVFGGAIGGGLVGLILTRVREEDVEIVFGSFWTLLFSGAIIGALGCVCNGWSAWDQRVVMNEPLEETKLDDS